MDKRAMINGNIAKSIIVFSLPLLAGNLFQQFYNTVDSIVVGNFVGKEALAAVGSTSSIINMIVGFFMGLSMGASVVISQYYGADDDRKVHDSVHTSIVMTFIVGIIMTFIGVMISPILLQAMKTPTDVMAEATLYLRIYFLGILGLMVYNMGSAILRAIGDSKKPLYFLIFASIINVILDLVFVIGFKLGVAGVALATICAQCMSALLILVVLMKTEASYALIIKDLKLHQDIFVRMLKVGLPAALQQSITSFSNIFVQGYVNAFGSSAMAGWSAYVKIDQFILLPMQSIALASTTFVGQNVGAKNIERARKGVKTSLIISLTITISLSILLNVFGVPLLSVFSQEKEVIEYGRLFLKIFTPFYFAICFTQIYAGALRGTGDSKAPMIMMVFSFVIFRQISLYFGTKIFDSINYVAFSYPMGWMLCALLMSIYYYKGKWMKTAEKLLEE